MKIRWSWKRSAKSLGQSDYDGESTVDAAAIVRQARRLKFRVRPSAVASLAGAYQGARPGVGLTFAELRAYEPGDEVRHIDWKATARHGRPYVRRYVEERSLCLWLVVDVSASLRFGDEGKSKADRAAQAAALLAAAAIQNGDRAGLVLVSDRVEAELPPAGGGRHLARIVRMLVASASASRKTRLASAIPVVGRSHRGSLVIVLSDFLTLDPVGLWRRASRRHDLTAIRIVDPREAQLPPAGLLSLVDSETGKRLKFDAGSRRNRENQAALARRQSKLFQDWCGDAGVTPLTLSTVDDPLGPLLLYFRGKEATSGSLRKR
jgi:uncharacterized protein (DUF58 family)